MIGLNPTNYMYSSYEIPHGTPLVNVTTAKIDHLSLPEFLNECTELEAEEELVVYVHTKPVGEHYLIYLPTQKAFGEFPINIGAGEGEWRYLTKE